MRPESSRPSQANLRNIGRNRPETRSSRTTSPSASTIASVSSSSRLSRKAIRASRAPGGQALQTGETSSSIRVLRIGLSFSFRRSVTANATAVAASRQTTTTVGASLVKVSDPSQRSIRVASFGVRNQPPASARHSRVKRFLVLLLGCAAVFGAAPGQAQAQECGLPSRQPLWIDFADGSVPYWPMFARPGVVAAAANFIFPVQIRARGAKTIYWEMNLKWRVGTPTNPLDPNIVEDWADRVFFRAVASSACARPLIALNEMWGSNLATPWSPTNAQYRQNIIIFVRRLRYL